MHCLLQLPKGDDRKNHRMLELEEWCSMGNVSSRICDQAHYKIAANDLAKWLEQQGSDSWWSIDGDPYLMDRVSFPCPSDELAAVLRRAKNPLLVFDARTPGTAHGETISDEQLDEIAFLDSSDNRVFRLCWESAPESEWLLVEDRDVVKYLDNSDGDA